MGLHLLNVGPCRYDLAKAIHVKPALTDHFFQVEWHGIAAVLTLLLPRVKLLFAAVPPQNAVIAMAQHGQVCGQGRTCWREVQEQDDDQSYRVHNSL